MNEGVVDAGTVKQALKLEPFQQHLRFKYNFQGKKLKYLSEEGVRELRLKIVFEIDL